jgi:outer membrane lipoprotein SlyB
MIALRVSVGRLVGSTVLDDLAVRANVNVDVREDRGQRCKRCREPSEQQVSTPYHHVMVATERKREVSTMSTATATSVGQWPLGCAVSGRLGEA